MRNSQKYSQQFKDEIIDRYQQSGLSRFHFCQLSDVPVSERTVSRWLQIHKQCNTHTTEKSSPHVELNIACYSLGNNGEVCGNEEKKRAVTLEEMITFQRDIHECCFHLYQMSCSKKNISLISRIKEVL